MSVVFQQRSMERQMLDAIGESVMATDADGRVTYANQAAAEAFAAPLPARSAFAVSELPMHALVEVEAWAYTGP